MARVEEPIERRVPAGPWGATWLLALCLALGVIASLERYVRAHGHRPSLVDDVYLWAGERARVSNGKKKTIALLGGSRIHVGVSTSLLRERLPDHLVVQLAIDATGPVAVLRDLAEDAAFRGVAIVSMAEWMWSDRTTQQPHVDAYHASHPGATWNRRLATFFEQRLALLAASGVRTVAGLLREGSWPRPIYVQTFADRSRLADYTLIEVEAERARRLEELHGYGTDPIDREEWMRDALEVDGFVQRIHERGGHVVFLGMPTSGEHLAFTEAVAPKAELWDAFAKRTEATMIHFLDFTQLASFQCPDMSHLDASDVPAFTTGLVDVLVAKGILPVGD